jgi:DNA repair exonuclease SbcCD ATPase subunit
LSLLKYILQEVSDAKRDALKTIRQIEQEYADSQLGDEEKEIVQLKRKYDELFKLANKYGIDTTKLTEAFLNEQNNIRVKYAQKEIDDENAKQEKLKKAEKEANDKALQDEEDFYEEYRKATQTAQQNEIDDVNDKYFNLIENAKKYGLDITELQRKQNEETAEINDKYRKEEEEKDKVANEAKLNAIRGTADALVAAVDSAFTGTFDQISESFDALGESLFGEEGLFAKLKEGSITAMEAIAVGVETITGVLNSVFEK